MQHIACSKLSASLNHLFPQVFLKKMFIHDIIVINSFVNMMNLNVIIIMIRIRQVICLKQWLRQTVLYSYPMYVILYIHPLDVDCQPKSDHETVLFINFFIFFLIKLSLLSLLEFIASVSEFSASHIMLIHVLSEWMVS